MKMKKLLLFLYLSFLFVQLEGSHTLGGEISWECLSDGKYQFKMKFFRDCSGIPWTFQEETIEIFGNPLPKNAFGNPSAAF